MATGKESSRSSRPSGPRSRSSSTRSAGSDQQARGGAARPGSARAVRRERREGPGGALQRSPQGPFAGKLVVLEDRDPVVTAWPAGSWPPGQHIPLPRAGDRQAQDDPGAAAQPAVRGSNEPPCSCIAPTELDSPRPSPSPRADDNRAPPGGGPQPPLGVGDARARRPSDHEGGRAHRAPGPAGQPWPRCAGAGVAQQVVDHRGGRLRGGPGP